MTNSRAKGARGELDVCRLIYEHTGWNAKRKVRQHAGDSDIEGVPGWCVEVKNCASPKMADLRRWWEQAVRQAVPDETCTNLPVLFYKRQPGQWRAMWPMLNDGDYLLKPEYVLEGSIEAWAMVAREGV